MDPIISIGVLIARYPSIIASLAFLAIATYYDVKYREIDYKLFIAMIPPTAAVYVMMYLMMRLSLIDVILNSIITIMLTLAVFGLARLGIKGYGDVFLVLIVGMLNPYIVEINGFYLTPLMITIMFGTLYVVWVLITNIVHNLRRSAEFNEATKDLSLKEKIYYAMIGKVMSVEEFKKKKFYFPLLAENIKRKTALVGVEPLDPSEYDIKGKYVVATYGFPFATLLLVGYIFNVAILYYKIVTSTGCV